MLKAKEFHCTMEALLLNHACKAFSFIIGLWIDFEIKVVYKLDIRKASSRMLIYKAIS